jgi:hypothetical protein
MRHALARVLLVLLPLAGVAGCGGGGDASGPAPAPTARDGGAALTRADIEMFVAVRAKALARIEAELEKAEASAGWSVARIAELSVAEQDAVAALGFDWRRYRWVREEVARLLSLERQRDDSEMLTLELTRAREDLAAQLKIARDPASRQFLEAQIASLGAQLDTLAGGRRVSDADARSLELIAAARADLAVQIGRNERMQKRIRDLVQRQRAGGSAAPSVATAPPPAATPASAAAVTPPPGAR